MTNEKYLEFVLQCRWPDLDSKLYLALALGGESGEVQNEVKKEYRSTVKAHFTGNAADLQNRTTQVKDELGDTLHYLVSLAERYGLTLEQIQIYNIDKLTARYGGVLPGAKQGKGVTDGNGSGAL